MEAKLVAIKEPAKEAGIRLKELAQAVMWSARAEYITLPCEGGATKISRNGWEGREFKIAELKKEVNALLEKWKERFYHKLVDKPYGCRGASE